MVGAGWLNLGDTSFEVGNVKYSLKDEYKSQSALVYGGKIGLAYQASRELDLFVEGAYQRTGNYSFGLEAEGKNQRVAEKDETVTTTQTKIIDKKVVTETPGELFLPNETVLYIPGGEGPGLRITCGEIPFILDEIFLYPECFRATEIERITDEKVRVTTTSTKVIEEGTIITSDPDFGNLDFSPGNGWSLKVGFRWFFNQPSNNSVSMEKSPAPDPVSEVQSESIPVPVRGLW
jgi:hypothetical protein